MGEKIGWPKARPAGYLSGVLAGAVLVCLTFACLSAGRPGRHFSHGTAAVVFDPPEVSVMEPWILPGLRREFTTDLTNRSGASVVVDAIECSHSWAVARFDAGVILPMTIADGQSARLTVAVTSDGMSGREHLKFVARGRQGPRHLVVEGSAIVNFVGRINVEPRILPLGELQRSRAVIERRVRLWCPRELLTGPIRDHEISAVCSDPSVQASVVLLNADEDLEIAPGDDRHDVGWLLLSIDPARTPERMNVVVTVLYAGQAIPVRVLGFTSDEPSDRQVN